MTYIPCGTKSCRLQSMTMLCLSLQTAYKSKSMCRRMRWTSDERTFYICSYVGLNIKKEILLSLVFYHKYNNKHCRRKNICTFIYGDVFMYGIYSVLIEDTVTFVQNVRRLDVSVKFQLFIWFLSLISTCHCCINQVHRKQNCL